MDRAVRKYTNQPETATSDRLPPISMKALFVQPALCVAVCELPTSPEGSYELKLGLLSIRREGKSKCAG